MGHGRRCARDVVSAFSAGEGAWEPIATVVNVIVKVIVKVIVEVIIVAEGDNGNCSEM